MSAFGGVVLFCFLFYFFVFLFGGCNFLLATRNNSGSHACQIFLQDAYYTRGVSSLSIYIYIDIYILQAFALVRFGLVLSWAWPHAFFCVCHGFTCLANFNSIICSVSFLGRAVFGVVLFASHFDFVNYLGGNIYRRQYFELF